MRETYERLTTLLYGESTTLMEFESFQKRWLVAYLQSLILR